ncbi:hypothetical protein RCL1_004413 [Eukaryota sp. TZLM3-RCL]
MDDPQLTIDFLKNQLSRRTKMMNEQRADFYRQLIALKEMLFQKARIGPGYEPDQLPDFSPSTDDPEEIKRQFRDALSKALDEKIKEVEKHAQAKERELNSQLSKALDQTSAISSDLKQKTASLATSQHRISELEAQLESEKSRLNQISKLEEYIEELKKVHNDDEVKHGLVVSELQSKIDSFGPEKEFLLQKIASLEQSNCELNEKLSNQSDNHDMESIISDLTNQLNDLQSKIDSITIERDSALEKISYLELNNMDQNSEMQSKVAELSAAKTSLEQINSELQNKISNFSQEKLELQQTYDNLQVLNSDLSNQINELQSKPDPSAELLVQIEELTELLAQHRRDLASSQVLNTELSNRIEILENEQAMAAQRSTVSAHSTVEHSERAESRVSMSRLVESRTASGSEFSPTETPRPPSITELSPSPRPVSSASVSRSKISTPRPYSAEAFSPETSLHSSTQETITSSFEASLPVMSEDHLVSAAKDVVRVSTQMRQAEAELMVQEKEAMRLREKFQKLPKDKMDQLEVFDRLEARAREMLEKIARRRAMLERERRRQLEAVLSAVSLLLSPGQQLPAPPVELPDSTLSTPQYTRKIPPRSFSSTGSPLEYHQFSAMIAPHNAPHTPSPASVHFKTRSYPSPRHTSSSCNTCSEFEGTTSLPQINTPLQAATYPSPRRTKNTPRPVSSLPETVKALLPEQKLVNFTLDLDAIPKLKRPVESPEPSYRKSARRSLPASLSSPNRTERRDALINLLAGDEVTTYYKFSPTSYSPRKV